MNWNDFNRSNPYFKVLLMIVLSLNIFIIGLQSYVGVPYWDTFNYLNNALYFAGQVNYADSIYLPPLIPLITAIFFKVGIVSDIVIFTITSLILVLGVMGFYLLLRTRFGNIESFSGAIIFSSLIVVLPWSASGGIDLPAVSLSIWALYFLVKGLDDHPRLLYFLFPTLALAFLARYTAGLIILPIFLYLIIKRPSPTDWKKIFMGLAITLLASIPFLIIFYQYLTNFDMVITLFTSTFSGISDGSADVAFNPNYWYYLQNIPNYISIGPIYGYYSVILNPSQGPPTLLSYIILFLSSLGLIIYIIQILRSTITQKIESNRHFLIKLLVLVFMIGLFLISFGKTFYVFNEILLFLGCYVFYLMFRNKSQPFLALDLLFLSWFVAYLIFHSILSFKVDRYFITMAPALVYFILLGFYGLFGSINARINIPGIKSGKIYIIIALLLLVVSGVTYTCHTPPQKSFVTKIGSAADWIKSYDHNYQNRTFASDYPNALSWYLKKEVKGAFPRLYPRTSDLSHYLKQQNVDYYVDSLSYPKPAIDGYYPIKRFEMVTVYKRI